MNLRPLDLLVQQRARNILGHVKTCASFAIIAGGYLRDQYYGVPFKDIDIFTSADLDIMKLTTLLPVNNSETPAATEDDAVEASEEDYVKDVGERFCIYNLSYSETPIQLMTSDAYTSIAAVLAHFDYGFCQIAFDGSNVLVTDAFWQDAANNTATFIKDRRLPQYSKHAKRLRTKYPNLTWIDGKSPLAG